MRTTVIAAVDQHVADAGCTQFAEGDFDGVGEWHATFNSSANDPRTRPRKVTKSNQQGSETERNEKVDDERERHRKPTKSGITHNMAKENRTGRNDTY
jgi:hypothetical protein